jgi:DinB family protein
MSYAAAIKPTPTEHAPEFSKYVTLVAEGDIIQTLEQQIENSLSLVRTIPSDKANFRYAPDKWSVKELLGHLIDSERIFSYRALSFARNDQTPLPRV